MARAPSGRKGGTLSVAVPESDRESLNIEKIKNGFLLTRSGSRNGKYFSEREFSSTKPVISAGVPAKKGKR